MNGWMNRWKMDKWVLGSEVLVFKLPPKHSDSIVFSVIANSSTTVSLNFNHISSDVNGCTVSISSSSGIVGVVLSKAKLGCLEDTWHKIK